jgi:hypothetical protein
LVELADGGLGIDIELAQRLDFRIEELDPEGAASLPREHVENAAAYRELSAALHGDHAVVAVSGELCRKIERIGLRSPVDRDAAAREFRGRRGRVIESVGSAEDHTGVALGGGIEHFEALCGGLGIGELAAFQLHRGLGEIGRVDAPEVEFGGESFALAGAFANEPEAPLPGRSKVSQDHSRQPCVGGFIGVIEHDTSRTRGREGQALREIRLPDGPLQPVILGFHRAGHARELRRDGKMESIK